MSKLNRIVIDPELFQGEPCIKGARIPVSFILELVRAGKTSEEIVRDYPKLEPEDIKQASTFSMDPYEQSRVKAPVSCLRCLEPIEPPYARCPNCGLTLDVDMMQTLRDNAFDSASELIIRAVYGRREEKGKIRSYYVGPPEGWVVYLTSIVLAAILGGLSYDAFKKVASNLGSVFRKRFSRELPDEKQLGHLYRDLKVLLEKTANIELEVKRLEEYLRSLAVGEANQHTIE